ncbi:MAG TPA: YhdP family protein [Caldimonas sp.]|nr:YhdP family protein [Caldimonas sp.]
MSVMSTTPALGPGRRPRRSPWRVFARWTLGLLFAAWSLLLVAWLSLHWFILPHIENWRAPLEVQASRALGVTVRIGGLQVHSAGWVPGIELRDVRLLDAAGRVALRLPRVVASLSPKSLVAFEVRFDQLLIDGPELEVRRDTQGRIHVAGLDLGSGRAGGDDSAAADWFFRQPEFAIRDGTVQWIDEQRDAPPLALSGVDFVVRNGLREHDMRLDATPAAEWGERFTVEARFRQPLLARSGDWRRWSGGVYASLPRADLRDLRRRVVLPFELTEGNGALRAWFELVEGEPRAATLDLALREVRMRLASDAEPLVFEQVQGRIEARRDDKGASLALKRFGFVTGDGIRWPAGDMAFSLRQRPDETPTGGSFSAQRLDVGLMAQVASRVPIGDAVRRLLADVNPRGVATEVVVDWSGPLDAPTQYRAKGLLSGVALASRPPRAGEDVGRPGLENALIDLHASERGGEATVAIDRGAVDLPGVFADSRVPLDSLGARIVWRIDPPRRAETETRLSVQVKDARFANADAQGTLAVTWSSGDSADKARGGRFPGRIELDGTVLNGVAARVPRYLPLGIPEGTRRYLEGAIRGGVVKAATFRVKGHVRDFPFFRAKSPQDGEFRITAAVDDGTFAFVPDQPQWPAFTRVGGELVIDRSSIELRDVHANSGAVEWSKIEGGIRSVTDKPLLALDGAARGPLGEMLRIVNATPIGGWIGRSLATATATGNAELKLALGVPLGAVSTTTVKGALALSGSDVRVAADTPLLANAKGRVEFTQKGFAVVGASARVLGGDATFEGGTQADDSIRFSGQGTASAEGLRRAPELGLVSRVAALASGQASYRATLAFAKGRTQVQVASNLVGLAIDVPAPLGKTALAPLELRYQTQGLDEPPSAAGATRDGLRLDLGNVLQVSYVRESSAEATRVVRGGIGVLAPAPAPSAGVAASLNLQRVDVDAWEKVYDQLFGPGAPAAAVTTPPAASTPAVAAAALAGAAAASASSREDYVPDTVALRALELRSGTQRLTSVVAGATDENGLWRANVSADELEGYVEYRPARRRTGTNPGRIYARLARLSIAKGEGEQQVETLLDEPPSAVPGLDIVVDEFVLHGRRLGHVEIEAANRVRREAGKEPVREWRLDKLAFTVPEAQFAATGVWSAAAAPGARRRASMDFKLAVTDSGAFLERLGKGKVLQGGKGQVAGQISWIGSPFSPDYPSLAGQVNLTMDAGQFLQAEPGASRLLSVLSLQSLPRRLSLDFRDLFEQGFAFDNVAGDVSIAEGVAHTNNLRMRGPAAVVLMEGNADLARETQDVRVVVVPEINAGTASLAYAIINPAIGIGTFLAQYFLRRPLIEAGTREFHVSGSWDDPKVERVEHKRTPAVSVVDPAASAASTAAR